jgi:phosphatidylcholine synthase
VSGLPATPRVPTWRKALGWAVHAYAASGIVLAAWIAAILMQPNRLMDDYRFCFLLLFVGGFIDSTATVLTRMLRITRSASAFDPRRLGDLIGFLIYVCLPLALLERAEVVPDNREWVLLVALVASAFGLSRADGRGPEGEFRGFPPYWNVVAFYLYALPVTGEWAIAVILGLSALIFVPTRYPNPVRPGLINQLMLALFVPWAVLVLMCVVRHWIHNPPRGMIGLSAGYPTLYLLVAWGRSLWRWSNSGSPSQ